MIVIFDFDMVLWYFTVFRLFFSFPHQLLYTATPIRLQKKIRIICWQRNEQYDKGAVRRFSAKKRNSNFDIRNVYIMYYFMNKISALQIIWCHLY